MVSKLKPESTECGGAAQCSELPTLRSAYVGGIGLPESNVLFSMCQSGLDVHGRVGEHLRV